MLGEVLLRLGWVELTRTSDNSTTELVLRVSHLDGVAGLGVADVQDLARVLLQWLVDNGHQLPELPALESDLEDVADDGPPPEGFGMLNLIRRGDRVVLERADAWVELSRAVWDVIAAGHGFPDGCAVVTGELLLLVDSNGRTAHYRRRPDVRTGPDTWALERTLWDPFRVLHAVPEHTR